MSGITKVNSTEFGRTVTEKERDIILDWVVDRLGQENIFFYKTNKRDYLKYEIYKTPNDRYVLLKHDGSDDIIHVYEELQEVERDIRKTYERYVDKYNNLRIERSLPKSLDIDDDPEEW